MKFNGASGVQVRTPSNLADLAAYTSLKFYITLPETARARRQDDVTKQFVFYLGNKDVSIATATQRLISGGFYLVYIWVGTVQLVFVVHYYHVWDL